MKKISLVEQIHNEFDTAQDRLYLEAQKILQKQSQLIPSDDKVFRKMKLMKEIGFVGSDEYVDFKKNIGVTQMSKDMAELIMHYKRVYPLQKFLTEFELDRICNKYGLIYTTIDRYIKNVPEKNLLDIKNRKLLLDTDHTTQQWFFAVTAGNRVFNLSRKDIRSVRKGLIIEFNPRDYSSRNSAVLSKYFDRVVTCEYDNIYQECHKIEKEGLFIAAPKKHFNLAGLNKKGKGFFLFTREVNDPIVFEYCRGGVLVCTKWGTPDDQSYLDESLINEINN